MPSLNLDLNYFDHEKTIRLVARLGPGSDVLPIKLWAWVGAHHPENGHLALLEAELEHICHWWGEKGKMVAALVDVGFLKCVGNIYEINDWLDHSGHLALFKKRAIKAARKRWEVKRKVSNASSNAKHIHKQSPSRAVPDVAVRSKSTPAIQAFDFAKVYDQYPNKDSRKDAERHFRASVKNNQDFLDIQKALANYIKHLLSEPWKQAKSAKTWFNDWRSWVTYSGVSIKQPHSSNSYKENVPPPEEIYDPERDKAHV